MNDDWIRAETRRLAALNTKILSLNLEREHTPWWKVAKRRAMRREVIHLMAQHTIGVAEFLDKAREQLCRRTDPHLHGPRCFDAEATPGA